MAENKTMKGNRKRNEVNGVEEFYISFSSWSSFCSRQGVCKYRSVYVSVYVTSHTVITHNSQLCIMTSWKYQDVSQMSSEVPIHTELAS